MDLLPSNKPIEQPKKIKIINPSYLCNMSLDIWRLKHRLAKLKTSLNEESLKPLLYAVESCERNLVGMGIEIKDDYTGEIYKSSMNVDVVTYESAKIDSDEALIKETLEPAILIQNELFQKAKVVVVTPKT